MRTIIHPCFFKLTLLTFFSVFSTMNAQTEDWCATSETKFDSSGSTLDIKNIPNRNEFSQYEPRLFNVKIWVIYPENYIPEYWVNEDDALTVVANLNREMNRFNIFYKYRGLNELYSDDYFVVDYDPDNENPNCTDNYDGFRDFTELPGNNDPNALNIYVIGDSCGFSGAAYNFNQVVVRWLRFKNWHTVHEVAHTMALGHTHANYDNEDCEHVTRDETDIDNFNAYDAGDGFKDTAAMPRFGNTNGQNNTVNSFCEYDGTGTDCQQNSYQISPIDVKNFMNNGTECASEALLIDDVGFTNEQGHRMRDAIDVLFINSFNDIDNDGDFSPLFEPYKGTYYFSGPAQNPEDSPHFQPGFDYVFVECNCDCTCSNDCEDGPSEFDDTNWNYNPNNVILSIDKYETDYSTIIHPNHTAIKILNLPENTTTIGQTIRRCYDNNNRRARDGNVTKFNDGIFNTNVTVTPKDSSQINSPALVEELDPGLYKVEKNFDDGSSEQTVIQKNE